MGIITVSEAPDKRGDAFESIRRRLNKFKDITINEFIVFVIVLAQFLYADKYMYGSRLKSKNEDREDKYSVVAATIRKAFAGTPWELYAFEVINLRNALCHDFGSAETEDMLSKYYDDLDKMLEFLAFMGIK